MKRCMLVFAMSVIISTGFSVTAQADITIVQNGTYTEDGATETTTETMYLTDDLFAVDPGEGTFMIINSKDNTITAIDKNTKQYYTMKTDEYTESFSDMAKNVDGAMAEYNKAMEEALKNMPPEARAEYEKMMKESMEDTESIGPEDYKPTGKTARIAGYDTEQYVAEADDGTRSEMWITKSLATPEMEGFIAMMGNIGAVMDHKEQGFFTFGFPLKTVDTDGSYTSVSEVKSISKDKIPSSVFIIPEGFQKIDFGALMKGNE